MDAASAAERVRTASAVGKAGSRSAGDRVNLETDILARHVQRLLSFTAAAVPALREAAFPTADAVLTRSAADAASTEGGSR